VRIGYFLSSEEHGPKDLVQQARWAEAAGFDSLWISDHYHPWNDEQGDSPFVWSVIGALAEATSLPVTTAVTCPTVRVHPAIIAQAAATSAIMHDGRFVLGVGSGEALNEQILGDAWPLAETRLEMLEEAVEVMRALWTGEVTTHDGKHYVVEHARIYSLPDQPPPVYVSAFGPAAIEVAARIADGFMTTKPSAEDLRSYRKQGGKGPAQGGVKVCYGADEASARTTAYRLWANSGVPGELSQVLRTPEHFMQASEIVTEEMIGESMVCGPDADRHVEALQEYLDAGYDEVYVGQIGEEQEPFFDFYKSDVLPRLRTSS
jgi:G6PDH family F420-dependent oxidoreductase